jgi:hypothetical protein
MVTSGKLGTLAESLALLLYCSPEGKAIWPQHQAESSVHWDPGLMVPLGRHTVALLLYSNT